MAKDKKDEDEKPKGGAMKIIVMAIVLLAIGAGGAYGAFAAGLLGGEGESGPDIPQFVRKGEADPYELPSKGGGKDEAPVVYGDGGSEYRTAYYSFEESFTSNLADSPGLIQVDLAVSTQRDGRVLLWVKNHELAIRSAILAQLAATPEAEVYSVEGKKKLSERLTKAINEVLEEKEGFGGIEAVHFKGFLVQ
ncbi:flagellar basal body-associated FliL family protein [Erythrobacter sp. THAF29]|uniref:flagellar basal body-associated FliL family protein n=1 Tax=Erythrobacter sp. THAF29 TaxID=2587851 RepID=UPI0012696314|nr:flagellar basal body-associated FliL family protein [Erythrobacter sp. THAF29]QFT76711.1 flagellar basal body-associated protein FliL-like protein [Erythrobacter sp. THAF29]